MSTQRIELGKISNVQFGYGGYQDINFGLSVTLSSGEGGAVNDFMGAWSLDIKCDSRCKWTEEDRDKTFAETMRYINDLMMKAKVTDVNALEGVPVEIIFKGNMLESWRILEEVI